MNNQNMLTILVGLHSKARRLITSYMKKSYKLDHYEAVYKQNLDGTIEIPYISRTPVYIKNHEEKNILIQGPSYSINETHYIFKNKGKSSQSTIQLIPFIQENIIIKRSHIGYIFLALKNKCDKIITESCWNLNEIDIEINYEQITKYNFYSKFCSQLNYTYDTQGEILI